MKMNIVLWAVQIILTVKFLTAAVTHGFPGRRSTMQPGMQRLGSISRPLLKGIAILMLLVCAGLILPGVMRLWTWLTPLTAALLAVMNLLAVVFHYKCRETPKIFVSIILFALAAFAAYGRWVVAPF
jgi:hypothetical protein